MRRPVLPRGALLEHPLLVGSLALLAVNDHVLKAWSGGVGGDAGVVARLVTGKASDVAGVVLVALLVGVVARSRWTALTGAALGFAALKVVPGVAEVVAPVLGGVTRRDATDLVALVALVPVARLLARTDPTAVAAPAAGFRSTAGTAGPGRPWPARVAGALAAALPVAVAGTAVLTISATACDIPPAVVSVDVDGDLLRAEVQGATDAVSTDQGLTWETADTPDPTTTFSTEPTPDGPPVEDPYSAVACTDDGSCFRTERGEAVQRRDDDGAWRDEVRLTPAQTEALDDEDPCAPQGRFDEAAVIDDVVVVPMGKEGVLRRSPTGEWARIGVTGLDPSPLPGWDGPTIPEPDTFDIGRGARWSPIVAGLTAMALAGLALRRRGVGRGVAVLVVGGGLALVGLVIVGVVLAVGPAIRLEPVVVVASVASFVVSLALALWPRRPRPVAPPPLPGGSPTMAVRPPEDPGGQRSPW